MNFTFSRTVPTGAVKMMEEGLDSARVVDSLERCIQRGVSGVIIVHANKSDTIYRLAGEKKIALFYSPKPLRPRVFAGGEIMEIEDYETSLHYQDCQNEIREHMWLSTIGQRLRKLIGIPNQYYYVPPEKAEEVGVMVKRGERPKEIIAYLGLESRVTSKKEMKVRVGETGYSR